MPGGSGDPAGGGRPVVLVIGATGLQGGGVARYLAARGRFAVRALTRDPGSAAARALARSGAEVVAGDLADRASLRAALRGCHGVFGMSSWREHRERAAEHGRNLVNAVAGAEIEHLVLSSVPAETAAYAFALGLPLTVVEPALFFEHFLGCLAPRPRGDGGFALRLDLGEASLAAVAGEDVGGVVAPLFERPSEVVGTTIGAVGDERPGAAYAEAMSRALGRPVAYEPVSRAEVEALGGPEAAALAAALELERTREAGRRDDLERSRALHPAIQTFEAWIERHRRRFEGLLAA